MRPGRKAATLKRSRRSRSSSRRILRALTPHQITPPQIAAVVNGWRHHSAATLATYRNCLARILRYADSIAGTRLATYTPRVPSPTPRTRTVSDNDFTRMYLIAEPWMRAFLLLTRTLGLRKSEALNAKPRDIALDTNRLTFRRKHEGSSNLPLTPELQSLFQYAATHDPDAPLVQTLAQRKVCQQFFYRHWWALKRRAAVDPNIIPHDLRRTAASRVYEQTRDLRIAQKLLGHRNLEATLHYLGPLDTGHLKQAIIDAAPVNLDTLPLPTEVKQ